MNDWIEDKETVLLGIIAHGQNREVITVPPNVTIITFNCPSVVSTTPAWIYTAFAKVCNTENKLFNHLLNYPEHLYDMGMFTPGSKINNVKLFTSPADTFRLGIYQLRRNAVPRTSTIELLKAEADRVVYGDQYVNTPQIRGYFDLFQPSVINQFNMSGEPGNDDYLDTLMSKIRTVRASYTVNIELKNILNGLKNTKDPVILLLHCCHDQMMNKDFKDGMPLVSIMSLTYMSERTSESLYLDDYGFIMKDGLQKTIQLPYIDFYLNKDVDIDVDGTFVFHIALDKIEGNQLNEIIQINNERIKDAIDMFTLGLYYELDGPDRQKRKEKDLMISQPQSDQAISKELNKLLFDAGFVYKLNVVLPDNRDFINKWITRLNATELSYNIVEDYTDKKTQIRYFQLTIGYIRCPKIVKKRGFSRYVLTPCSVFGDTDEKQLQFSPSQINHSRRRRRGSSCRRRFSRQSARRRSPLRQRHGTSFLRHGGSVSRRRRRTRR